MWFRRLLAWTARGCSKVFAHVCLSAAWILGDGGEPKLDLAVPEIAEREPAGA